MSRSAEYDRFRAAIDRERLPLALIDLDAFERNADRLFARAGDKKLRLASKSLRSLALLERLVARGREKISGVMSFTARESRFLVEHGFRDVLLAYPTSAPANLEDLAVANRSGATTSVVVDDSATLGALSAAALEKGTSIPVVLELNLSDRLPGFRFGVLRSPLATPVAVLELAQQVARTPGLSFHGVMGYEAQIAGVTNRNPFAPALDLPKRWLKVRSAKRVAELRAQLAELLSRSGLPPRIFNGGGTGSLATSVLEPALSELTAGSGFMAGLLFDYYQGLELEPAAMFALQVVRKPGPGVLTCHGGGYLASGEAGPDRLPRPYLPPGLSLRAMEGAGEVQTPLLFEEDPGLLLGDPVFFRHAKSGELCEHFNELLLLRGGATKTIEARARTYRGMGQAFL